MKKFIYFFFVSIMCAQLFGEMPNAALDKLKKGNQRFVAGKNQGPKRSSSDRQAHIESQEPFCAILACADSRVAPEILFDQGIGSLFVVRVAGNVASTSVIESLDFATNVLHVPLIVVMGHQNCGAVAATIKHTADDELGTIASLIQPAVKNTTDLKAAIIANVRNQVKTLRQVPLLQNIQVMGAYYDFVSGTVSFLTDH